MVPDSPKPLKFAEELRAELDWAAHALTGDASAARIVFALPALATRDQPSPEYNWPEYNWPEYNWDVEVSCRSDQDEAAQAAIVYVANKWNLAAAEVLQIVPLAVNLESLSAVSRATAANGADRASAG